MRLPTLASSFIYLFPSDFIPPEVINDYAPFLEAYHMPYDNILDYINSTIKTVSIPGVSFDVVEQTRLRGKKIAYKPAKPSQDILTTREFTVIFKSVDGNANQMILREILDKHYLDTEHIYVNPFTVITLDMFRNALYQFRLYEIIVKSISELLFDNTVQKINPAEFTMTFQFNYSDLEFLMTKSKILDVNDQSILGSSTPRILNK